MRDELFKKRFSVVLGDIGSLKRAAEILNVTPEQIARWRDGKSRPPLFAITELCEETGRSIDWLVGLKIPGATNLNKETTVQIPRYDVHLSAGDGRLNEDNTTPLDHIPFTREFLQKKLSRSSIEDLVILEATGDSMLPTISDGALVLVDKSDEAKVDGLFAYIQDEFARIKRLRFMVGGEIEIVSDNNLYSPQILSKSDLEHFRIIGRVRWIGHTP